MQFLYEALSAEEEEALTASLLFSNSAAILSRKSSVSPLPMYKYVTQPQPRVTDTDGSGLPPSTSGSALI